MAIHTKTNICSLFWAIQRPKKWGAESPGYPVALLPKNCPRPTRVGRESVCDPPSPQKSRPRRRVVCPFCVTSAAAAAASFSSPSVSSALAAAAGSKKKRPVSSPLLIVPNFFLASVGGWHRHCWDVHALKSRQDPTRQQLLQRNQRVRNFPFWQGEKSKKIASFSDPTVPAPKHCIHIQQGN